MSIDLATQAATYLKPNGHGGYIISASALSSWARCQLQKFYEDQARVDPDAPQPEHLSITVYGSVMHAALHAMERAKNEGDPDALALGLRTFEYYWQPENLAQLDLPMVTVWLRGHTWDGMLARGLQALRDAWDLLDKEDSHLLALEYPFAVPMEVNGRLHTLHGFIDRLAIRKHYRKPYVSLDDYKSGKKPTYLRHNTQFTFYAYASTKPEFWLGWPEAGLGGNYAYSELEAFDSELIGRLEKSFASWGYALHSGTPSHGDGELPLASRRGRWINVNDASFSDAGWRNQRDYARLALAIDAYVRAREAGAYSLNISGETCTNCAFRRVCGGIGLPEETDGAPA